MKFILWRKSTSELLLKGSATSGFRQATRTSASLASVSVLILFSLVAMCETV